MNTINLLVTSIVIPEVDSSYHTKSEDRYVNSFLPVDSFKEVFPIDDCLPEI